MRHKALKTLGRADLIGNSKHQLLPTHQPLTDAGYTSARRKNSTPAGARVSGVTKGRLLTQHTGLPSRETGTAPHTASARAPGAGKQRGSPPAAGRRTPRR